MNIIFSSHIYLKNYALTAIQYQEFSEPLGVEAGREAGGKVNLGKKEIP